MKPRELKNLGIPSGEPVNLAIAAIRGAIQGGLAKDEVRGTVRALAADPAAFLEHPQFGKLARKLAEIGERQRGFVPREGRAPYEIWGRDFIDAPSIQQMENACSLPVTVRGALMPDAHVGYGLPIGGVLATRGAVIPYAVGVDIACRMKMTVLDLPVESLENIAGREQLRRAIETETSFGVGAIFKRRRQHEVLDEDWTVSRVTRESKDKAWSQLGTSGSGNHFVEFGALRIEQPVLGLEPGAYLALLSHSGSRGTGAQVCDHYSRLARELRRDLPKELSHLAWLDLASEAGAEYWAAMELMGKYAAANHACIHRQLHKHLGARCLLDLENHHNFAWKEQHDGEELIVHRKGATPAGQGVIGIIPGSMASPTYIARGLGNAASLDSASHGAGRVMSRTQAINTYRWKDVKGLLEERRVELISAGLDEVPMVYKDIHEVMAAQRDLVEPLAQFQPRLVKMAPAGERPED